MRTILVTGGAGFIGSNFIRHLLRTHQDVHVTNLDKLTYAGNPANLRDVAEDPRYRFVQGDICDEALVRELMAEADAVVHFAAESHVDRSLLDAAPFIQTNVHGTYVLLCAARDRGVDRFVHVSTDEVYGVPWDGTPFTEEAPLRPRNPYSASKAGGDLQCLAFWETYRLPVLVVRPANNVGPYQYPEKAVPLFVTNALEDQPLPVYGRGEQRRDRLFVEDCCEAVDLVLQKGEPGEVYNIWAGNERSNLEVAERVLDLLGKPRSLIRFVEDRPGHDPFYRMDATKLRALGWEPRHDFDRALERTVRWYVENRWWWEPIKSGAYREYYQQQYGRRLAGSSGHS
ncbi:MAG TPA: dTDP-glucose 4,6-dehydratase [Dehalococcoidia bacterium]